MTIRRDLKRRIRERQEQTGERYTTARAHVLGAATPPSWVVELHDVSAEAQVAGLLCPVRVTSTLWRASKPIGKLLEQLRQILLGPIDGLSPMQRAALYGQAERQHDPASVVIFVEHIRTFLASLEQGLRGPGPGGRMLAFESSLDGRSRTIIAQLLPQHLHAPLLVLSLFRDDHVLFDALEPWISMWPLARGARP